jgi:glycosyltransferase involved in cell wall biosynthesis
MNSNNIGAISIVIPAYNAENTILKLLQSINSQKITENVKVEVVIADDASIDSTCSIIQSFSFDNKSHVIKLISHDTNKGRSSALNTAINHSSFHYCISIDSDCWFGSNNVMQLFIHHFQQKKSICFGFTSSLSTSFWGRYHRDLYNKRTLENSIKTLTTANFGFNKALVLSVGGFCTQYTHYGFEDRDLILSIMKITSLKDIAIEPSIIALHDDEMLVCDVANKMYASAKYSSVIFNDRFSKEYCHSIYGRIDSTIHKTFTSLLLGKISPIYVYLIPLCQKAIEQQYLPFLLKKLLIKIISALAFAKGCKDKYAKSP